MNLSIKSHNKYNIYTRRYNSDQKNLQFLLPHEIGYNKDFKACLAGLYYAPGFSRPWRNSRILPRSMMQERI